MSFHVHNIFYWHLYKMKCACIFADSVYANVLVYIMFISYQLWHLCHKKEKHCLLQNIPQCAGYMHIERKCIVMLECTLFQALQCIDLARQQCFMYAGSVDVLIEQVFVIKATLGRTVELIDNYLIIHFIWNLILLGCLFRQDPDGAYLKKKLTWLLKQLLGNAFEYLSFVLYMYQKYQISGNCEIFSKSY